MDEGKRTALRRAQFTTKIFKILLRQTTFEKCPGVYAWSGMTLKVNHIAEKIIGTTAPEVIETDLPQRCSRGKGGNVAPIPSDSRLARTTMAMAFQRIIDLIRRSICWLPGKTGSWLVGILLI